MSCADVAVSTHIQLIQAGHLLNLIMIELTSHLVSILSVLDLIIILARRIILLDHEGVLLVLLVLGLVPLHHQLMLMAELEHLLGSHLVRIVANGA